MKKKTTKAAPKRGVVSATACSATSRLLAKLSDILCIAESGGLRVRVEPLPSGHSYGVGLWGEMSGKDMPNKENHDGNQTSN